MKIRDFRSDTVTQPTDAMRQAMACAVVGDDTLGEDPTVTELEQYCALLFKKEAALLVASGTMANQVAVQTFCQRGQEAIVGAESHIYNLEVGALAALAQVQAVPIYSHNGYFDPVTIRKVIREPGIQKTRTGLLCLENTYNLNGGIPLPPAYFKELKEVTEEHGVPIYLDGARIFNAAAALNATPAQLTADVDAAMFCLTKGLAAPFGAVLVGSKTFIEQARWMRQRLGGGFRQIGHMAAAGLVGLKEMRGRISEDHENARRLANGIAAIDARLVNIGYVQTNIVNVDFSHSDKPLAYIVSELARRGVKIKPLGAAHCRMVTHYGLSAEDIDFAIEAMREVL